MTYAKFSELPIGALFFDVGPYDGIVRKTSDTGARDHWCAKGLEMSYDSNELIIPAHSWHRGAKEQS